MPITITTRGYLEVYRDDVFVSRHTVETKAIEAALEHAEVHGDGDYELRFPRKILSKLTRTIVVDTTAPTAPSSLTATAAGQTTINLAWSAAYDVNGIARYDVLRGGSLVNFTNGATLSYSDTSVAPGTTYSYTVRARDQAGNISLDSNLASATTDPAYTAPFWLIADVAGVDQVIPGTFTPGSSVPLTAYYSAGDGTPYFTVQNATNSLGQSVSVTINSATGAITAPTPVAPATTDTYTVTVDLTEQVTTTGDVPTLTVTGTGAWTAGAVFKKGAAVNVIPSTGQIDVRNRWSDGSLKFAVVSGIGGTSVTFSNGTPPTPTEVALSASPASIVITGDGAGTYACPFGNAVAAWNRSTAHLVRKIPGATMTERHYFVPTSDPHLSIWWYVRSYSNGSVEVETVVENGWLNVASPTVKTYAATLTVGSTVYNTGTLTHYHHTRWSRVDWINAPTAWARQSGAYLQSTNLVPTYASLTLDSTAYDYPSGSGITPMSAYTSSAVAYQAAPFTQHGISASMGSGGDKESYGPVPAWAAAYLVDEDSRAYLCTVANGAATMRYSAHYRDESDGRPWRVQSRPTLGLNSVDTGVSERTGEASDVTPAPSGGVAANWYVTHSPAAAFAAYLLSGRWVDLEEQQFQCGFVVLATYWNYNGKRSVPFWMQNRGQAWMFRDMVQRLHLTPTEYAGVAVSGADAAQVTDAAELVATTVAQWYDWYISGSETTKPAMSRQNAFGLPYQNTDFDFNGGSNADGEWAYGGLQNGFYVTSVLYAYDTEPNADATTLSKLESLAGFHAKFPTGLLGGDPNGASWDWRLSGFVNMGFGTPGATSPGGDAGAVQTYRASWNANWTAMQAAAAYNWLPGTFPIAQDNYMRKAQTNGTNYVLAVREEVIDDTDTRALWWSMHYAHKIADRVTVTGIDTVYPRLTGSLTWTNTLASRATVRPDYALVSDR